jgi:hypothetical protein
MNPVTMFILPDNGRMDIDPNGTVYALGQFTDLPVPMPRTLMVWTGPDGKPLVMWADRARIRPTDFGVVWEGVRQFNEDCRRQGIGHEPVVAPEELDDVGDDWEGGR